MNTRKTYFMLSLYFIGFGILVALLTSFVNYQMQVTNIDDSLHERFEVVKESRQEYLKITLEALDATLGSIAKSPITQRYLTEPSPMNKQVLQDLMLASAVANPRYMQVRLLSESGMELVRVNRSIEGHAYVIPDNDLQDKSERYYYKESISYLPDEYWHSRLDLNIENGEIEHPIRPTLRIATPIQIGPEQQGLIIVNVDISYILTSLSSSADFIMYLKDKDEQILHHPSAEYAWTRYLDDRSPLPQEDEYAYEFPLDKWLSNGEGIKLVMQPKPEMLNQIFQNNLLTAGIIAAIVIFISFPLSWLIALLPTRLQRQLTLALSELQRTSSLLDKYLISSHTDKYGVITSVSEQMCSVSGYSKNELISQDLK